MLTRKDLLQAHRLMTQRASQALVLGEPDSPELPMRRLNVAVFCGVMVAVLIAAAFGVIGLLKPGGAQNLDQPGTLLIEKETGARYVWCQDGHTLCPVANYTSARLLAAGGQKSVSRNSLAKYERGPMLGIMGAPDTLPDSKKLVKMPWSVCVRAVDTQTAGRISVVQLLAGRDTGGQTLTNDQAVLVQAAGQPWLIWRDKRMKVPQGEVPALSSTATLPTVTGKWLNALTPGSDFKPPDIPGGLGREVTGPTGGKARVGQLYQVENVGGAGWYVLMDDGIAPISDIEAQLLKVSPGMGVNPTPQRLTPEQFTAAPKHPGSITNPELQGKMPTVIPYTDGTPLCAMYNDKSGNGGGTVTVGGSLPTPPQSASGGQDYADQVEFPPGGAALAGVLPGQGKANAVNTVYLVTEGRRFALSSKDVAQKLGYNLGKDAVPVPASILQLIPTGPILDPSAASKQVTQVSPQGPKPTAQPG